MIPLQTLSESLPYTPDSQYVGSDSFTFHATDGIDDSDSATVTIAVSNQEPVAYSHSVQLTHDSQTSDGVYFYDDDWIDTPWAVLDTDVSHGSLSFGSDGYFTYTPAPQYVGSDSFTYHATDGIDDSDSATVTIEVLNQEPVAYEHSTSVTHDTQLNDQVYFYDDDWIDTPWAVLDSSVSNGTLDFQSDGSFTYIPTPNYAGPDSFTYHATDGIDDSTVALVSIQVTNAPPNAEDDGDYPVSHSTATRLSELNIAAPGVLANDSDDDGDELTVTLENAPQHAHAGGFQLNQDGSFIYIPAVDYVGPDSFTYRVSDGIESDTATVSIDVGNVPPFAADDPEAAGLEYQTLRDTMLVVDPSGVLENDYDPDGDDLTAWIYDTVNYGYVGLDVDGGFNYTPGTGYVGGDTFTYRAFDGHDFSDLPPAAVTIHTVGIGLSEVYFQGDGNRTIREDPGGSDTDYTPNHWRDLNMNGDAEEYMLGDHCWPVAYVGGSTMELQAVFYLTEPWHSGDILLRASGPDGIAIPETVANVQGASVYLPPTQATTAFADTVRHYDNFDLVWEASCDDGDTWIVAGMSSNDLYVTLDAPQVAPLYHTVVHLGSHFADGATTEDQTITEIWNDVFDGNTVERVDGMKLWYYKTYSTTIATTAGLLTPQGEADAKYGEGMCTAWVNLMLDVLAAQGIQQADPRITLHPDRSGDPDDPSHPDGFLVKNWEFASTGHSDTAISSFATYSDPSVRATLVQEYPYLNMIPNTDSFPFESGDNEYTWLYSDVEDASGVDGKGPNANPASIFEFHKIVQLEVDGVTAWYDPSYGEKYTGTTKEDRELAFENAAIEAFFIKEPATIDEADIGVDLNDDGDTADVVASQKTYLIQENTTSSKKITSE